MSTQFSFYAKAVPLSSQKHADLSVETGQDYSFAKATTGVPLTAVEFRRAASEFAIVFAGDADSVVPVAILGAVADTNAYVKEDGSWTGKYIPAFVRRYPFVFATADKGKNFTLCIDESFTGCNREGRGERLFDTEGKRTEYLEKVLAFQKEYQMQFQRTQAFCAHLKELDLLEPMQAQFRMPDGQTRRMTGFMAVNLSKLKKLDDAVLARMAKNDELELIYLHVHSVQNLANILPRTDAAPQGGGDHANEESSAALEEVAAGETHATE